LYIFKGFEETFDKVGSPGRTRTADPVVNSHLLYRLSYRGISKLYNKVFEKGLALFFGFLNSVMEAGTGIEPVYKDLQSSTSPLCHPATIRSLPVFQALGQECCGEISRTQKIKRLLLSSINNHYK
jgi:hypothetical protein